LDESSRRIAMRIGFIGVIIRGIKVRIGQKPRESMKMVKNTR